MLLRAFTGSPEQDAGAVPFLWQIVKILFRKERKLGEGRRAYAIGEYAVGTARPSPRVNA